MKVNVAHVKRLIGWNFFVPMDWSRAGELCKQKLVAARRANNEILAAELSQAKEFIKRRLKYNRCSVCGVAIKRDSKTETCRTHKAQLLSQRAIKSEMMSLTA